MTTLLFMGDPSMRETFRCRVYGDDADTVQSQRRRTMLDALASSAGWTELDSLSHMNALAELQDRGWVGAEGELVPNPDGPGRVKVWRLTEVGMREWEAMKNG